MTVAELKAALDKVPDSMSVFIRQTNDDFAYSLSEDALVKVISFWDADLKAKDSVFVITDAT